MPNPHMVDARKTGLLRRPSGIIPVTALWPLCRYRHNGHWVGHRSRLNRDLSGRFGDQQYAAEELIAELTSAFLCAHLGITGGLRHAGYIDHWLTLLRGDRRAIFTAAGKASQAADYLRAVVRPSLGSRSESPP